MIRGVENASSYAKNRLFHVSFVQAFLLVFIDDSDLTPRARSARIPQSQ